MPAQDEADPVVTDALDVVRVVLEKDDRTRRARGTDGEFEFLLLAPVIPDAAEVEDLSGAPDGGGAVGQVGDACPPQAFPHGGGGVFVVVMIAQNSDRAVTGPESGEFPHAAGDPLAAPMNVVAGECDQVRREGVGHRDDIAQIRGGNPGAVMKVGHQGDAESVEGTRQSGDRDVPALHGAAPGGGQRKQAAAGSSHCQGLDGKGEKFPARHGSAGRGGRGLRDGGRPGFAGEFFRPVHFGGGGHEHRQRRDRAERNGQAGQPVEEEAIAEEDHITELREGGDAGEPAAECEQEVAGDQGQRDGGGNCESRAERQEIDEIREQQLEREAAGSEEKIVHGMHVHAHQEADDDEDREEEQQRHRGEECDARCGGAGVQHVGHGHADAAGADFVGVEPGEIPAAVGGRTLAGRACSRRKIDLGEVRFHAERKVPHAGFRSERIVPLVESARLVGDGEGRLLAGIQGHGLGDRFASGHVGGGGFSIQQE